MTPSRLHKLVEEIVAIEQGRAGSREFDALNRLRQVGFSSPISFLTADVFVMGKATELPTAMVDFGFDLMKRGLFHLPYSQSIFEFALESTTAGGDQIDWITILAFETKQEITAYPIYTLTGKGFMFARSCFGYTAQDGPKYYMFSGEEKEGARQAQRLLAGAVTALISKSVAVETIEAPERLNKARMQKGRVPLLEYRTVKIPGRDATHRGNGQSHASPRLHWRRGHYRLRRLTGERDVPVAPCLVGTAENGVIRKEYLVDIGARVG